MAAAIRRGEIIAAWIHDPLGDDTAMALRGEGAWTEAADGSRRPLRVAAPVPVDRMVAAVSWGFMPQPLKGRVTSRLPRLAATVGLRCAAHEYRLVAGGHAHALIYNKLMPWDHAPGWLLHREAGGYSARFDGSDYQVRESEGGLICAPDETSYRLLRKALLDV
jgi:fructose-1,6-bisphosphatase/inositol monophosphatase family enzyme